MRFALGSRVRGAAGIACGMVVLHGSMQGQTVPRAAAPAASGSTLPALIPIEALYESPAIQWGGISPDGRWLSYMKPWRGHQNVFVRRSGVTRERNVTRDSVRSIGTYWWSADGKRILWLQDRGGDENYHLHAAEIVDTTGHARDLTPFKNVEVEVLESETALAVTRATEQFLGACLGGRVQPRVSARVTNALAAMRVNVDTLHSSP